MDLNEARVRDASVAGAAARRFSPTLYTQPALRPQGRLDVDDELRQLLELGAVDVERLRPRRRRV